MPWEHDIGPETLRQNKPFLKFTTIYSESSRSPERVVFALSYLSSCIQTRHHVTHSWENVLVSVSRRGEGGVKHSEGCDGKIRQEEDRRVNEGWGRWLRPVRTTNENTSFETPTALPATLTVTWSLIVSHDATVSQTNLQQHTHTHLTSAAGSWPKTRPINCYWEVFLKRVKHI